MLFAQQDLSNALFDIVYDRGLKDKFVWVGSDAWSGYTVTAKHPIVVDSALGVQFQKQMVEEFDNYFRKLVPKYFARSFVR